MLMHSLLHFLVGSTDPAPFIKTTNENKEFLPFYDSKYGNMLIDFFDGVDLGVHVELMNQVVKFWGELGMPKDLLEACFYTLFSQAIVYDDCLEVWKDQDQDERG